MGKGDKKTRRGKITIGSYGVKRPRKKSGQAYPSKTVVKTVEAVAAEPSAMVTEKKVVARKKVEAVETTAKTPEKKATATKKVSAKKKETGEEKTTSPKKAVSKKSPKKEE